MKSTGTAPTKQSSAATLAQLDLAAASLAAARSQFLALDNVIGVGYGFKETDGRVLPDTPAILVYVDSKKDKKHLDPKQVIPTKFHDLRTDVIERRPGTGPAHDGFHGMWLDQAKIHYTNPQKDVFLVPLADQDVDGVAVLEIDNTFVNGSNIDFVKATKRFLTSHPDVFDFITFYVDTSTGLPNQGSYHSGIYNKTTGINYYAGSNLDNRATFGTQKLQAMLSLGWIGNAVLLQELAHMWAAFVRNRDTQNGANLYDLLISNSGQGLFHWGRYFDNDHSPMDYDGVDWEALGGNQFQSHTVADDFYHFCPLDLYLMGLIAPSSVESMYAIQNPSASSGAITGTRKNIALQNVVWAEGARNPAYPNTQQLWKQAFVVLTKNAAASQNFTQQVAQQRREFSWQFYKATRFLGRIDTTLVAAASFPSIQDVAVAADNDRAFVGWKTSASTKGRVNYATTPLAFDRSRAHAEPFSSVSESTFSTSHGVLLTGLTPNSTYYIEVIVESQQGLVDRAGPTPLYTRKTNDTAVPDINNVSVQAIGTSLFVKWKTDEACDSRVRYGKTTPPLLTRSDPYPTTNHAITLTGLSSGVYNIVVASQDAAGNLTTDDNGGAYYKSTVPLAPASPFLAARTKEIAKDILAINAAVREGDKPGAVERTAGLISGVAEQELRAIAAANDLPKDGLEAAFSALSTLASRLGADVETLDTVDGTVDFTVVRNPLASFNCLELSPETVTDLGVPAIAQVIEKLYPGLMIEKHPSLRANEYRIRRNS